MLDKKSFETIRKDLEAADELRESVIQLSREMIQSSKKIIYALHRNDVETAKKQVAAIEKQKAKLQGMEQADTNMDSVALQEYAEALCYYEFIVNRKVPKPADLGLDTESYLLGLCDLTGELVRKAVNEVIAKNPKEAVAIKKLVEDIYTEFLEFNLRNSELRKKSDQIKWNLKKLEDVVYDLEMKGAL